MPDPQITSSIIGATTNSIGQGLNAWSTARQNRKSREWSEEMYERQKQDNIDFWNRSNEYNTPAKQMERYKQAGLNPALMYGQGSAGNASPISKTDIQSPQFKSPELGGMLNFMNALYDLRIKGAQYDNLKADNTVKANTADLIAMQSKTGEFDYNYKSDLRAVNAQFREEELRKLMVDKNFQLSENQRREITTKQNIAESVERVLMSQANRSKNPLEKKRLMEEIKNLKNEGTLKKLHVYMRQKGIEPQDDFAKRLIGRAIDEVRQIGGKEFGNLLNDLLSEMKESALFK